ncbi:MAG: DMT family transporter [Halodesulfurarchaeum sp.]
MAGYRNFTHWMVLAAVWGTAFMAIKAGLGPFGDAPVFFAAIRYDIAGLLMLGYVLLKRTHWRPVGAAEWQLVAIGGTLLIAGYHAFLFVGEQQTTSAAAAVIVSLSPVLTTGFARAFLRDEGLTGLGVFGLFLGLIGVVILADPNPSDLLGGNAVGEFLVFLAALSFALGTVLAEYHDASVPVETMEAWSMIVGAVVMHAASLGIGENVAGVAWTLEGISALLYLAVVSSAGGFLIYFDLLDRLGPIEINLVSYVTPIWAALTGWLVLGETIDTTTVLGFGIIFLGFWFLKREALSAEIQKLRRAIGD